MKPRVHLLIIDPQNDFCDLPAAWLPRHAPSGALCQPALPVPGAHADLQRLAGLIDSAGAAFDDITITLDSHHRLDIAHPGFWQQPTSGQQGHAAQTVSPFTPITAQQVRSGQFQPRDSTALPRTLAYLDALEARGRYTLMVWPVHCEIGTWGHNVHAGVQAAYSRWEEAQQRSVFKLNKGSNPWTEHYSAVQAEVPDAEDPGTLLNQALLDRLGAADAIFIAGQASSHCVRASTEDIVAHLPGGRPQRITLLADCMSPVAGFQAQHDAFFSAMRAQGVQLASAAQAGAGL